MRHLRVVLKPIHSVGLGGHVVVRGFALGFARLGRAVGANLFAASTTVELSCALVKEIRADQRGRPELLATVSGQLTVGRAGPELSLSSAPLQTPPLDEVFERQGRRRPRRRLFLEVGRQPPVALLLPDAMQVRAGFMEVTAKLTVNGEIHADEGQNDTLDVPLLPLSLTHALFHFVDSAGEALAQRTVLFDTSFGETREAVTDDFGEIHLDASRGERFTVTQLLPAGDAPVAVVETRVVDGATALV